MVEENLSKNATRQEENGVLHDKRLVISLDGNYARFLLNFLEELKV